MTTVRATSNLSHHVASTWPRVYLGGSGRRAGIINLVSYRREYGARLAQLGFHVLEPYDALLRALAAISGHELKAMASDEIFSILLEAINVAQADDVYCAILARHLGAFHTLADLENVKLSDIATPGELGDVYSQDARLVANADIFVAYLASYSAGTEREAKEAERNGIIRYAFGPASIAPRALSALYALLPPL